MLYYIKSNLGYGGVSKYQVKQVAHFRISDRKCLNEIIFPIFDKHPLLTSKYFTYLRFKKAYSILENKNLTTDEKNQQIKNILSQKLADNYIAPSLLHLNENSCHEEIKCIISIYWLVGFTEAEGNFGIFPDRDRFNIEYTLVQKLDKLLLLLIKRLLHIPSNVYYNKKNFYVLNTKNSRVIEYLISLFSGKFKGMKSLEFKLWSKANYYKKTNLSKLSKIHKIVLKLRKKMSKNVKVLRQLATY